MDKIRHCTPYYAEYETAKETHGILSKASWAEFESCPRSGSEQYFTRNSFMTDTAGADKLLEYNRWIMQDSDVYLTENMVGAMWEFDEDIVCLPYLHSDGSGYYNAGFWKKDHPGVIDRLIKPGELEGWQEVDFAGGGALMFKYGVARDMGYPWFMPFTVEDSTGKPVMVSEDHSFFYKAKKLGYKVYCNFSLPAPHKKGAAKMQQQKGIQVSDSQAEKALTISKIATTMAEEYALAIREVGALQNRVKELEQEVASLKEQQEVKDPV